MKRASVLSIVLSIVVFSAATGASLHVYAQTATDPNATSGDTSNETTSTSAVTAPTGTQTSATGETTAVGTTSSGSSGTTSGGTTLTDTTPPVITNVWIESIISTGAQVRWNTDDPSLSGVTYSLGNGSYLTSSNRCDGGGLVTSHCVYITNLTPGTQYFFSVASKNAAGHIANMNGPSFRTLMPATYTSAGTATTQPPPTDTSISQPVTIAPIVNTTVSPVPAYTSGVRILEEPKALVPQPVAPTIKVITPASSTSVVPPSALETPRTQLENVGTSVRTFQNVINNLNDNVQSAVTRDVERVINSAMQSRPAMATAEGRVFDPTERAAQLAELKRAVQEKQQQLSRDVQTTLTSSSGQENPFPNIEPVLKSSLDDISLLIKNETGVSVDLSPTARTVASDAQEQSAQFDSAREALQERDGLDLYTDSDRDGISDYDEVHIYHTDSRNAYSSGGSLTDGEKIVLGFDVSTSTLRRVPVESPMVSGEEAKDVFEVHTIAVTRQPLRSVTDITVATSTPLTASSTQATLTADPVPAPYQERVTFAGRALPNSFVTLYIYSTPIIVTVKTDISGTWEYTLDSELPDGEHNLYVATVDAGGKILAKSPAIPFVKTAEAAEFTPLIATQSPGTDPLDILRNNMLVIALVGFGLFALVALAILGVRRTESKNDGPASV